MRRASMDAELPLPVGGIRCEKGLNKKADFTAGLYKYKNIMK